MNAKVYNKEGKEVGTVELPAAVFGLKWNADLVHQVVTAQAANRRPVTAHAKGRSEVSGGGKKPWRQKGTGRARHGSIRSPLWRKGGVTHGPLKEKKYGKKVNKKMAHKALFTVLSAKARDGEILVTDRIVFDEPKTKRAALFFQNLMKEATIRRAMRGRDLLTILQRKNDTARRAVRNLPYVGIEEARNINAYDLMQYAYVLFPKETIASLVK